MLYVIHEEETICSNGRSSENFDLQASKYFKNHLFNNL